MPARAPPATKSAKKVAVPSANPSPKRAVPADDVRSSRPRPIEVTPVGKYALKFKWNDGHEAGIYSWDYLRRVCQCPICSHSSSTAK